jgi:hypothetical protein
MMDLKELRKKSGAALSKEEIEQHLRKKKWRCGFKARNGKR